MSNQCWRLQNRLNQPLANTRNWQQWLTLLSEGNNLMQEQHNAQNYLGNLLQRIAYCCNECVVRFIELVRISLIYFYLMTFQFQHSDMTTRRQADGNQRKPIQRWLPSIRLLISASSNPEERSEIHNLTGRFEVDFPSIYRKFCRV